MVQRFTDKHEDDPTPRRGHKLAADPAPKVGRKRGSSLCACGRSCPRCQAAQADGANRASADPGSPLDSSTRQPLERFFQRDLNDIRLFSDDASRSTAQSLGAVAYTCGQDIHLSAHAQGLSGERRNALLAHEITHALQQPAAGGEPGQAAVDAANAPGEQHADAMSRAFVADRQGRPEGAAMRDRLGAHRLASPRLQLTRFPTHYGEFEDNKFNEVKDAAGTLLDGEFACSASDPMLPASTRLSVLGQYGSLPQYVRVMVADGPLTGKRGVVRRDLLTREVLGTRP